MSDPVILKDEEAPPEQAQTPEAPPTPEAQDPIVAKLLARIAPADVTTKYLKVLIYGNPGTGKTTFASTAPSPLFIDIERGTRTISHKKQDVLEYVSIDQIEAVVAFLKKDDPAFAKYETIVFDSLSEMQRRVLDSQLGILSKSTRTPVYKADWGVYGENTQRMRALMSAFRDIPRNLVVTAHAKWSEDDTTKINMVGPDLTHKLANTVAGMFDVVAYLRVNTKGEHILRVRPSKTVIAKTRVTTLPEEITNATWESLLTK